jgi:hypothetical protein
MRKLSDFLYRPLLLMALVLSALQSPAKAQQLVAPAPCPCRLTQLMAARVSDSGSSSIDADPERLRLARRAQNYSLLGTLVPLPTFVLTYPGLLVGPSLGYFYAGHSGRAWTGIGIRALATGGMISSFVICGWDCGEGDAAYNIAWAVFITSTGVFIGSAIYDIATVKGVVLRGGSRPNKTTLTLAPRYFTDSRAVGMQLRLNL